MAQDPSSAVDATSRREFVKRGVAVAAVPVLAPLAHAYQQRTDFNRRVPPGFE